MEIALKIVKSILKVIIVQNMSMCPSQLSSLLRHLLKIFYCFWKWVVQARGLCLHSKFLPEDTVNYFHLETVGQVAIKVKFLYEEATHSYRRSILICFRLEVTCMMCWQKNLKKM